ncbi:MAG: ATP-grasp domain-containing protein, partial [Limnohabitans sp.]|nr:ATP-grasp domain-containing protein [Limnohabitans sp.]
MTPSFKTLPPGSMLGVMGGGQLGRMFVHAAQTLGYQTAVLDPDPQSPAGCVSHHHIAAAYTDTLGLEKMADICDSVTTEFENVPAASLQQLMQTLCVSPQANAVAIAQDRAEEKKYFVQCGLPVAPHQVIHHPNDLQQINPALLPGILKTTSTGYDGKGQVRVSSADELKNAWHALQGSSSTPVVCILEKMLPLASECSVIVARSHDCQMVHLPVQCNLHRNGILAVTEVFENNLSPIFQQQAIESAKKIAQGLEYIGVMCVEFFVLTDGALVVSEIAPRPHNSGH